jgi:hypothetical protein
MFYPVVVGCMEIQFKKGIHAMNSMIEWNAAAAQEWASGTCTQN